MKMKIFSYKTKGVLSIIGAFLLLLILGTLYTWANINGYYASYLKYHENPDIKIVDAYFLMPIISFLSNICGTGGAIFEAKFGARAAAITGLILTLISHTLLLFFNQLLIAYLSMSLFGIGIAISYFAVLRNCWKFFPDKKGLLGGLVLGGYGLSALFMTSLADYMINPGGKAKPDNDGFYPEEIAENIYNFIYTEICIFAIIGIIAVLCIFPHDENERSEHFNLNGKGQYLILNNQSNISQASIIKEIDLEPISKAFTSKQFYLITIMISCTQCEYKNF